MAFPLSVVRRLLDPMGSYGGSITACFSEEFAVQGSLWSETSLPEAEEPRDFCLVSKGGIWQMRSYGRHDGPWDASFAARGYGAIGSGSWRGLCAKATGNR